MIPTTIVAATTAMVGEVGAMAATSLTILTAPAATTITVSTITRTTTIHSRAMMSMTMGEIIQQQIVCLIIRGDSLVWVAARSLCRLPKGTRVVVEDRAAAFTLAAL